MCLSTFLALVIGFYVFFVSLAMLVHQQRFKKIIAEFLASPAILTLTGGLGLIFGLMVVTCHNVWVSNWPVLITLIGWFTLLQGILRLYFPDHFVRIMKDVQAKSSYGLVTWIWLLIGIYLIWSGMA